MINHISIRDFAIIKNTDVDFYSGLNIITGETGSGKSIVVTAISLALGSRADSSFVRFGTDKAIIELSGEIDGEEVIISREINSNGKNLCKLNGRLVTLSELQLTCQKLADIHGQYDNQSLLNTENHLTLVDTYGFEKINELKSTYTNEYQSYIEKKAKLNKLLSLSSENARKLDFYKFEISEIKAAKLVPGEDTELEERLDMLKNSEKITSDASHAYDLIDGEHGAYSTLGSALSYIESLSEYSGKLSELLESCNDAYYRLEEAVSVLRDTVDEMTFDPSELDEAIERLELIKSLKKKNEIDRVTIKGKVTAVCPKKGCWVTLENTQNVEVFVKMKDYAFFLPQNIAGKTILLDAKVTKQETSVKELRHYAEDAGKSKEEIAKITKPKVEIRVLANGIKVID